MLRRRLTLPGLLPLAAVALGTLGVWAGEADIKIPPLDTVRFEGLGGISGTMLMYLGALSCAAWARFFGLVQYKQTKALPVHESMSRVSHHHLGDLQDLPVHAGQVPGDPLGADCRVHDLFTSAS